MSKFCYEHPESSYEDDRNQYGVRVDTERYSYLMRLNPNRGEYNLYCYCYQKEWLNNHLKNAERGIRFIDPHYQEQFRIADGEKISIKLGDGKTMERTCRYIDDYHLEVGTNLYHMPRTKRKDKSRVVLRTGESQRADGTYHFSWTDANHKRRYVYAKTLDELRYNLHMF